MIRTQGGCFRREPRAAAAVMDRPGTTRLDSIWVGSKPAEPVPIRATALSQGGIYPLALRAAFLDGGDRLIT